MRKLILLFFLAILPLVASAKTVEIDGIMYSINKNEEAKLVSNQDGYLGYVNVDIPSSFTYEGVNYSVTSIGNGAFLVCTSLVSITIPNSVTSIEDFAFSGCSGLTSVTIPNSVTSIGRNAFKNCSGLTSITIQYGVTSIGNYAFSGCSSLTSVTIPNSVTSIGWQAFSGCSSLTSMTLSDSVTSIGDYTFYSCSNLTSVTIPNSVTSIGNYAFAGCSSLTSVTIPNSVMRIANYAFSGCKGLTSVTIPNNVTSIEECSFYKCSGLTSVSIPNNVKIIEYNAFDGCKGLTSVTIPNSVTSIDDRAFSNCKGLTSVIIGNSVTYIGAEAFEYCSGLTSITIPNSVTNIGDYAFRYCKSLADLYYLATDVFCTNEDAFKGTAIGDITLHVPKGCVEKYAAAEPWKNFKNIVEIEGDIVGSTVLRMAAQEENGLVRLKFNVVPGEISYRITRTDKNGAKFDFNDNVSHDPSNLEYVDYPPAAGTYTYLLKMAYYDSEGEKQVAKSNTVTVTVSEPLNDDQTAQEYGFITGRIECDKYPPVSGLKVSFSDNDVTVNARGTIFSRQRIPVGTEVTMIVSGDESHEYESAKVTIKPGLNFVSIKGTLKEGYTPNENEYDLQMYPDQQFYVADGKHHVKFTLYNPNEDYTWVGSVIAELVQINNLSSMQIWTDEKLVYRGEISDIRIWKSDPKEIDIIFNDMEIRKDTRFYLYLKSKGRWNRNTIQEKIVEKTIITTTGWIMAGYEVKISKTYPDKLTNWNNEAKEDFSYLIMGLSSLTPGMDGVFGDFSSYQYQEKMLEFAKEYTGKSDKFEAVKALFEKVQEWVDGKTVLETLNEIGPSNRVYNGSSTAKDIIMELRNIFLPEKSILQKFRKDIIVNIDDIHRANAMMGNVLSAYNAVKSVRFGSTLEQVMNCASTLYGLAADTYVPLQSMMYTYMEAGQTLVNAAKQLQQVMHDAELPDRLIANDYRLYAKNGVHDSGDPSYNTTCDFKLTVKNSWGFKVNFKKGNRNKQIKDITISASNDPEHLYVATYQFDMQYLEDGIMLKIKPHNTLCSWAVKPMTGKEIGGGSNLTQFFMTIYWANDRISIIPLNQNTDGVDINCGTLRTGDFNGEDQKPSLYHVTLTTESGMDNMSDLIYLGSNKDRK